MPHLLPNIKPMNTNTRALLIDAANRLVLLAVLFVLTLAVPTLLIYWAIDSLSAPAHAFSFDPHLPHVHISVPVTYRLSMAQ